MRGEAFSDPSKTQEMPEGWQRRPVKHAPPLEDADLVVILNQQIYAAFLPIMQEYAEDHGIKIAVGEGTCGIAAGALARKEADIGSFCCPPGETDRLPGLRFHTLGIMPIALVAHPENPLDGITMAQAQEIFQGLIYRWSEVRDSQGRPGKDVPILTIGRLHCKLRPGHWRLLLDDEDLFSARLQEVESIPDMISLVAADQKAIGYEVPWMLRQYRDEGRVKILKVDGLDPRNLEHLVSGDYPLYRTFSVTTWEGEGVGNPRARELVEHLLNEVERLGEKFGIAPASRLRQAGWKFNGDELVGEPR
ncbi:MAG: hypothetical protein PVJ36_02605 [Nitrospirota bacterium]|jgi:ABC-type phosphate transport system substrate-binding protein